MTTSTPVKVTALIPKDMLQELKKTAPAETLTESLKIALKHYIYQKKIERLHESIKKKPLRFRYSAEHIRNLNRQV